MPHLALWTTKSITAVNKLVSRAIKSSFSCCLHSDVRLIVRNVPCIGWLGKKAASLRLKTAQSTDARVKLMSEIIGGIQVIKMYTWEEPFAKLVAAARRYKAIN